MEHCEVKPLVSVLLASYNHEKYVEAAVRSVMAQKGVSFELIVIDDGSKDHSHEILTRLQKELGFNYIHRPNKGVVATLNEMLAMAKGRYFCTFSSDDVMPQDRLLRQSSFLENNQNSVACFGQIKCMSMDGIVTECFDPRYLLSVPSVSFEELLLGKKSLHGCSEMLVTDVVKKIGGYDSTFFFEDFPLFLKILHLYGPQPVLSDVACCFYREDHGSNLHANHNRMYSEILKIIDCYRDTSLYRQAVSIWKTKWFSALAYNQKWNAIRLFPKLANMSFYFMKRLPKLFIPSNFLKY